MQSISSSGPIGLDQPEDELVALKARLSKMEFERMFLFLYHDILHILDDTKIGVYQQEIDRLKHELSSLRHPADMVGLPYQEWISKSLKLVMLIP